MTILRDLLRGKEEKGILKKRVMRNNGKEEGKGMVE